MTWVEVTMDQLAAAEAWWNARTPQQREEQWPRWVKNGAAALFPCRWGVFSGCEAAYHAMTLMDAGLICADRKPVVSEKRNDFVDQRSL